MLIAQNEDLNHIHYQNRIKHLPTFNVINYNDRL